MRRSFLERRNKGGKQMNRNKNKRKKNHIPKRDFRIGFGFFALVFSCLLVLGSTYAWFVSADSITNKFEGTRLDAAIVEVFTPNLEWKSGTDTTKEIRVTNTGPTPELVRISLYEYFLAFQVDTADKTGNGNLVTTKSPVIPSVDAKKVATWEPAVSAGGTYTYNGQHVVAEEAIVPDAKNNSESYHYGDPAREKSPVHYVTLNFSSHFYETAPAPGTTKYWLYEDGYFYYSEVLQPGQVSEALLDSVTLSSSLPNKYKGALYQLNPYMDAHDLTKGLLKSWNVGTNGPVFDMLNPLLKE